MFLIFDAYGTLAELDDFYGRLQREFAERGLDLPTEAVKQAAHAEMRYYMKNASRANEPAAYETVKLECAAVLLDDLRRQGYEAELPNEAGAEILTNAIVFHLYPETLSFLETLKEHGVKMAVASNWDAQLPAVLSNLGVAHYFEFIFSSAQIGYEKPAPEFFERVHREIERCTTDVVPCYYVGDHWEKDVVPALAAGFTPVWLERKKRDIASGEAPETADGIAHVRTLCEIPGLLLTNV